VKTGRVWIALIRERVLLARGFDITGAAPEANFRADVGESIGGGISVRALIDLCLKENERRMAGYDYDARLLRPTTVPWLARIARRFIK